MEKDEARRIVTAMANLDGNKKASIYSCGECDPLIIQSEERWIGSCDWSGVVVVLNLFEGDNSLVFPCKKTY